MTETRGFVLFGDVVRSRTDAPGGDGLAARADRASSSGPTRPPSGWRRSRSPRATSSRGCSGSTADPFLAVLRGTLDDGAQPMRWAIVAGPIEPGRGPATERTGPAFLAARDLLDTARARRDGLLVRVGEERADALLAGLAPLLADLLADLTDRQRSIARLMLVERLRQSEVAERLGVSRATISVMAERARIRRIDGLLGVLRRIVRDAVAGAGEDPP